MKIDKLLSVGIDYYGTSAQLANCSRDALDAIDLFTKRHDVSAVKTLLDYNPSDATLQNRAFAFQDAQASITPTRANILKALDWLISVPEHANIVFWYSGHGAYTKSETESDGFDETICPLDAQKNGDIIDDELLLLFKCLPKTAKVWIFTDCCHSGSNLDLPYTVSRQVVSSYTDHEVSPREKYFYLHTPQFRGFDLMTQDIQVYSGVVGGWMSFAVFVQNCDTRRRYLPIDKVKLPFLNSVDRSTQLPTHRTNTWVSKDRSDMDSEFNYPYMLHVSACRDDQTASDGMGINNGAFTHCLKNFLHSHAPEAYTIATLIEEMTVELNKKMGLKQKVAVSSSKPVQFNMPLSF